jgi:hypothetical protein
MIGSWSQVKDIASDPAAGGDPVIQSLKIPCIHLCHIDIVERKRGTRVILSFHCLQMEPVVPPSDNLGRPHDENRGAA